MMASHMEALEPDRAEFRPFAYGRKDYWLKVMLSGKQSVVTTMFVISSGVFRQRVECEVMEDTMCRRRIRTIISKINKN